MSGIGRIVRRTDARKAAETDHIRRPEGCLSGSTLQRGRHTTMACLAGIVTTRRVEAPGLCIYARTDPFLYMHGLTLFSVTPVISNRPQRMPAGAQSNLYRARNSPGFHVVSPSFRLRAITNFLITLLC